ncbi:MAG: PAS domain S-box protein [Thermoplasmata archaeon]|nr:PAS domain S-box protein [Thermoplasmata archaeon]
MDSKIHKCNKAMAELLSKPRKDIEGATCREIVDGVKCPIEECPMVRLKKTERRESEIPVDPLLDNDSNPDGPVHVVSDITERKKTEDAMKRRTRDLGERVKELRCLYEISKYLGQPGVSSDEVFQKSVNAIPPSWQYPEITCARITLGEKEFTTPNWKETSWKQSADILANGKKMGAIEVAYLEEKPEIEEGPFLKEERDLIGTIASMFGNFTERLRVEEGLRESEEKYKAIVENATDFIFLIDKNDKIQSLNIAAAELFGKGPDNLVGKSIFDMFPKDIATGYSKSIEKVFESGKTRLSEARLIVGERDMWISASLNPVRDHKGKITAVMGVTRDITERKRSEEKLQKTVSDLERFNRIAIDREQRMIELKRETNEFLRSTGKKEKYRTPVTESVKNKGGA